ncbi:hypothetical protein [Solibacillus sp. FSL K6-1523]|uniref:hypothetical protein n=1 Tax=Solibacillus sp. FSL K6-1523 TaxID=2921471 RepID=UPI0030FA085D
MYNNKLSATDVLENANFDAENRTVTIHTINTDKEDIFTEFKISEEAQREVLKAFENAKFEKITSLNPVDYDYRITISLNRGYPMYLDSTKKSLTLIDTKENYTIINETDLFDILKKATK